MYSLRQSLPPDLMLLIWFQLKHLDKLDLQDYLHRVIAWHDCHSVTWATANLLTEQGSETQKHRGHKPSYP